MKQLTGSLLGFQLWRTTNIWQRQMKKALASTDLTPSQYMLLSSVAMHAREKREATQTDLATHTKMDVMMTSELVRKLEANKLVKRQVHPRDTRARLVTLTPKGESAIEKADAEVLRLEKDFFPTQEMQYMHAAFTSILRQGGVV